MVGTFLRIAGAFLVVVGIVHYSWFTAFWKMRELAAADPEVPTQVMHAFQRYKPDCPSAEVRQVMDFVRDLRQRGVGRDFVLPQFQSFCDNDEPVTGLSATACREAFESAVDAVYPKPEDSASN